MSENFGPNHDRLYQWVIYKSPRDAPGRYVVRRWSILCGPGIAEGDRVQPDLLHQEAPTLEAARRLVPEGFVNLGRQPGDDPAIAEVWT